MAQTRAPVRAGIVDAADGPGADFAGHAWHRCSCRAQQYAGMGFERRYPRREPEAGRDGHFADRVTALAGGGMGGFRVAARAAVFL